MPSPIGHGLVGAAIAYAVLPRDTPARAIKILAAAAVASMPDLDFVLIVVFGFDHLVHRGFTHSLPLALVCGLLARLAAPPARSKEILAYTLALGSHGILDALTTVYGSGVALFWPILTVRLKLGLVELPSMELFAPTWSERLTTGLTAGLTEVVVLLPLIAVALLFRRILRSNIRRAST